MILRRSIQKTQGSRISTPEHHRVQSNCSLEVANDINVGSRIGWTKHRLTSICLCLYAVVNSAAHPVRVASVHPLDVKISSASRKSAFRGLESAPNANEMSRPRFKEWQNVLSLLKTDYRDDEVHTKKFSDGMGGERKRCRWERWREAELRWTQNLHLISNR